MNDFELTVPYLYPESALYEDVNWRTIIIPLRTRIFKASPCLKVHIVSFKLASLILT